MEVLSTITVNCRNFRKIFTQTKLTDVLYRIMLYFELLQKFSHMVWLIHSLNYIVIVIK